jgi:hypothetical protein
MNRQKMSAHLEMTGGGVSLCWNKRGKVMNPSLKKELHAGENDLSEALGYDSGKFSVYNSVSIRIK